MNNEVRLVAMRFIPNENFGGTLVPVEPAYTHSEAWEDAITEKEARFPQDYFAYAEKVNTAFGNDYDFGGPTDYGE